MEEYLVTEEHRLGPRHVLSGRRQLDIADRAPGQVTLVEVGTQRVVPQQRASGAQPAARETAGNDIKMVTKVG